MGRNCSRGWRATTLLVAIVVGTIAAGCTPAASSSPAPSLASPAPGSDPFSGLTYRLDLPAGWAVLGTPAYDASLDAGVDMTAWLTQLDLVGPNAFRAYEPMPVASGLRIAANTPTPWRSAPPVLQDAGLVAALPGVTGEPEGDMVGIGRALKATRFRWTETLDWGGGAPTMRTCVGYQVMGEFEPVTVVFSYPADTDRAAEVDALIATIEVLGSPAASLPPGMTMPPSPTPYDKSASPEPAPVFHGDPGLEALLPDSVDGVELSKQSKTGVQMGLTPSDPLLAGFGKLPSDLGTATAMPDEPPLLIVGVQRIRGVPAAALLAAVLAEMPDATVTRTTLGGREVTYVEYGAWPVWYYATGELLYGVAGLEPTAADVLASLP